MNPEHVCMGKISYINASPVFYGLDHGLLPEWLTMVPDVPSVLNRKIMTGQVKVSPISSAFYAMNHKDLLLLPDLSIACHGRVMSVILASHFPMDDLDNRQVLFSRESATSAAFLKMIFDQRKISPVYTAGAVDDFQWIADTSDAALVIGDAALKHPWDQSFEHCIDLGQLWYEMTQLPFVFAVWAVRRSFARKYPMMVQGIHQVLLASKQAGYAHMDEVVDAGKNKLGLETTMVKEYFDRLYCDLDNEKIKAMKIFFDSLFDQEILKERPDINFFETP